VTYNIDAITGEALYYNATISTLMNIAMQKNSSINGWSKKQKLRLCIGKCRNKI
jgi:predicted GIY-YIG superfamily endonuclease